MQARYFNPRSLAGATNIITDTYAKKSISIHAPLRERLGADEAYLAQLSFQSTLPCGSDYIVMDKAQGDTISIHAPLRERQA